MILLQNLALRPITIELPPELDPQQGLKQKVGALDRTRKRQQGKQNVALRVQHRTVGRTVTLMARGTAGSKSAPLCDAWGSVARVQELQRKGDIKIIPLDAAKES